MPNLSWNAIHDRAVLFARDWSSAEREQADKQTFWNEFFDIFGIPRRTVASFEEPVRRLRGTYGFIDLLWKGKLLIEHKSAGASLEAAETQAFDYLHDLQTVGRGDEIPRYVLLSDFKNFALFDLEPEEQLNLPLFRNRRFTRLQFPLADLPLHVRAFAFIPGYQVPVYKPQDPLNLKAVEIMATVHDTLKAGGFSGHDLMRFLVRVLFCMFADKTGIFQPDAFRLFIENRTSPDGSNLGAQLNELFATLDKQEDRRQKNLDDDLKQFPYVNGALFSERLDSAAFTGPMRKALLDAANYKWAEISPAIFGALFQEVMKPEERRKIGAHYTSERDILKVIHPLFLDKLREEFTAIQQDRSGRRAGRLEDFRVRLTKLKFLDPACGCGNFLVIAYRELRVLELEVLRAQHGTQQGLTLDEVSGFSQVNVDQFYGIEIDEWPARIAEVALWLMDHQSNLQILSAFGQPYQRLPLKQSPHIHIGNALRMDWNDLIPAAECSYILGNPPFLGKSWMSNEQKHDMRLITTSQEKINGAGVLDYVAAWYFKASRFIHGGAIEVAFVSTNSLSQGEQPSVLWHHLYRAYEVTINFAYQTFDWMSEARGRANVDVVIIGFSPKPRPIKLIFPAENGNSVEAGVQVTNISPYLIEGGDRAVTSKASPLCAVPAGLYGSKPVDAGALTLLPADRELILSKEPNLATYMRPYVGTEELLHGKHRWCLWLENVPPSVVYQSDELSTRLKRVQTSRQVSKKASVRAASAFPALFTEIRQPESDYLAIPEVSSEKRHYIPMRFMTRETVCSNKIQMIPGADTFLFGVLTSEMHMAWVRLVCGRLESRFDYSTTLVYNNFPWPQSPMRAQKAKVEEQTQAVLAARLLYPDATLGQLYGPLSMPPELVKAHQALDRAVERCYRPEPFSSERERVEFLFALYEQLTAPLLPAEPKRKRTTRKGSAIPQA